MFLYNVKSNFKQPYCWFQRDLCTPLDAISYTNNAMLVMAALSILGGIFVISFAGDIASMSEQISSINNMERKYLSEKIDVMSVDSNADNVVITLVNYGKYPVEILGILDSVGNDLTCDSNNSDNNNFVINPDELLEFICEIGIAPFDDDTIHYIITDTMQIIEARP